MTPERSKRKAPTVAEWTIFAVASLLIIAVAGVLVYDWLASSTEPASFEVVITKTEEIDGLHHVEAEVTNVGGEAAAEVTVGASLEIDGDVTELDEMIDFLSADEDSTVTFIFQDDPAGGELTVDVSSYREP